MHDKQDLVDKLERQKADLQEKNKRMKMYKKNIAVLKNEKEYLVKIINKLHEEMNIYNQMLLDGFTLDPKLIYSDLKRENERLTALVEILRK